MPNHKFSKCICLEKIYVVRQESNETGAMFFYLTFTYKSTLSPSK